MVKEIDLSDWKGRRELLVEFQSALIRQFGENDYNVFVFGSYVRQDFEAGKSDIDLIVYCEILEKKMDIADFCMGFFRDRGISADVLEYYFMEEAYVYVNGILNSIPLTDYYPKKLRAELYLIAKRYSQYLEGQQIKRKYMNWDYVLQNNWKENKNGRTAERYRKVRV